MTIVEHLSRMSRPRLAAALAAAMLMVAALIGQALQLQDTCAGSRNRATSGHELPLPAGEPGGEICCDFQPDFPDPELDPPMQMVVGRDAAELAFTPCLGPAIGAEPMCRSVAAARSRPVRGPPAAAL